jgi:hypothetical protein
MYKTVDVSQNNKSKVKLLQFLIKHLTVGECIAPLVLNLDAR